MKLSQKLVGPLTEAEVTTLEELGRHHRFADIRFRARGVISLHAGCKPRTIAQVLGVSEQSVYNWAKWWELAGLVGLLGGHQGGRPAKLTAALVDSAMAIAAAEALTLGEIKQRVRERHPHAADFSEDRLAARLKARGFSFKRCRLSLKKNAPTRNSPRRKPPSNNGSATPRQGKPTYFSSMNRACRPCRTCSGRGRRGASRHTR